MSKRNALRIGSDPHSAESVSYTVKRYGPIKPETLAEMVAWLETPEAKAERTYEVIYETISSIEIEDLECGISEFLPYQVAEHSLLRFPTIKTIRKGSAIFKIIDNEHDAQNTLANIRNKDFPNNKQGS